MFFPRRHGEGIEIMRELYERERELEREIERERERKISKEKEREIDNQAKK